MIALVIYCCAVLLFGGAILFIGFRRMVRRICGERRRWRDAPSITYGGDS